MTHSTATTAEAGWYHVQGDPPGTVRRWNGTHWIGFPIPDPMGHQIPEAGTRDLDATHRISKRGQIFGTLSLMMLAVVGFLFGGLAIETYSYSSDVAEKSGFFNDLGISSDFLTDSVLGLLGLLTVAVLVAGFVFSGWLKEAAWAAQIHRYNKQRAPKSKYEKSTGYKVFMFLIFGWPVLIYWVMTAGGGSNSAISNKGIFGMVSDSAMAASLNRQTGVSEIGPIKIFLWWTLWWGPLFVMAFSLGYLYVMNPEAPTVATVVQLGSLDRKSVV